jgi:hypothetical protein
MRRLGSNKRVLGSVFDVAHKLNAVLVFAFVARISKDSWASLSKESSQHASAGGAGMKKGPSRITFKQQLLL